MTGRGMGYCAGYDAPGYMQPGYGYGRGIGFGHGFRGGRRGWRHARHVGPMGYGYPPAWDIPPVAPRWTAENEIAALKQHSEMLENALADINRRIEELSQAEE